MSSIPEIIFKEAIAATAKEDEHTAKMEEISPRAEKLPAEAGYTVFCQSPQIHFQSEHYKIM